MRRLIFLCLFISPLLLLGQEATNYLEGAVPEVDGKVVFKRTVSAPQLSKEQIFIRIARFVQDRFKEGKDEKGRILYQDIDEGAIVCWGEEYLVFTQKALVLDRALINYQVTFNCSAGVCDMDVSRIRYEYASDTKKTIYAEEWITDKHAYDKKRNKLIRGSDKFRTKTIDLVDGLEKLLRTALEAAATTQAVAMVPVAEKETPQQTVQAQQQMPSVQVVNPTARAGYNQILPTEINGNFINMLMNGKLTVFGNKAVENSGVDTQWGGIGYLFNKPVLYYFAVPSREVYDVLEKSDLYTIVWTPGTQGQSIYKELLFECRKVISQSIASEAIAGDDLKMEWSGKTLPKLYTVEITGIWVK